MMQGQARRAPAVWALIAMACGAMAHAEVRHAWEGSGVTLQFDNDLLSGAHRDQDYSWGVAVSWAGTPNSAAVRSVFRLQGQLDALASVVDSLPADPATTWQIGVLAFTPASLRRSEPIVGDRPYASLTHLTRLQTSRNSDGSRAAYSALRVGWLGGRIAPRLHKSVHQWIGDEVPKGWHTQISDGGEPTLSYWRADDARVLSSTSANSRFDGRVARVLSVGTQTYAGVAMHGRWSIGSVTADCFLPLGPGEYMAINATCRESLLGDGWVVHFGGLWRHVVYNAFLQGQFRDSDYVISSRNMRRDVGSFWLAVERQGRDFSWVYSLRYSTPELRSSAGARDMIWAGLQLSR